MNTLMLIALALTPHAHAEDSEFEGTEEAGQEFKESETKLSAELGGALAAGNTQFWTVNGLANASHKWSKNQIAGQLGANLGQGLVDGDGDGILSNAERNAGQQRTAEKYWAEARYDRFIGKQDSLYALAGALVDPFAGYDLRSHEQLGYSRILVTTERTHLVAELGIDVAQENFVDGVNPGKADVIAARGMVGLSHAFSDDVAFTDTLEVFENVISTNDLRILNEAALTSRLSDTFSLKLSHKITWDNEPVQGFRKTDHTALATLVASIF